MWWRVGDGRVGGVAVAREEGRGAEETQREQRARALGGRAHLGCHMDEFLVFIVILDGYVAKLSNLWRSAPAEPREHVGHGAQAKLKPWVNCCD